jgi:predicted ArsR family transcriptional regulator
MADLLADPSRRLICDYLTAHPWSTATQVGAGLGWTLWDDKPQAARVKRHLARLEAAGLAEYRLVPREQQGGRKVAEWRLTDES